MPTSSPTSVPAQAWVVTGAGTIVNLCLGILYAWSVWKLALLAPEGLEPGSSMSGINEGWVYLSSAQATLAFVVCGFVFSLSMIPGGIVQARYGPKIGVSAGGICLALGCIVSGLMKSYLGLILGFGFLGGVGMGFGYAATTPAAVRWFGPHQRGRIVGLVVGGYGAAAIYIAPFAKYLIAEHGITGSFIGLGCFFAAMILLAAQFLTWPPSGYVTPSPANPTIGSKQTSITQVDWTTSAMARTWQFYALFFLFFGAAQSGLIVIANAAPILSKTAKSIPFFAANDWLLASFIGFLNAFGRIVTGIYSDKIGRGKAYFLNGIVSTLCMFLLPMLIHEKDVLSLFVAVGFAVWHYGGTLSLLPAFTADYFGSKHLGQNYGLMFIGWGAAFFVTQLAGYIEDLTGSLDNAFYLSGGLLLAALVVSLFLHRPITPDESRHHES